MDLFIFNSSCILCYTFHSFAIPSGFWAPQWFPCLPLVGLFIYFIMKIVQVVHIEERRRRKEKKQTNKRTNLRHTHNVSIMKSTSVGDKTDTSASLLLTSRRSLITLAEAMSGYFHRISIISLIVYFCTKNVKL